jgi:hypothetical protein
MRTKYRLGKPNQVKAPRFAMVVSVMAPNPGALWLPLARAWSIVSDPHGHPHCDPVGPLAEQSTTIGRVDNSPWQSDR